MKTVSAVIGSLLATFMWAIVIALIAGGFVDTDINRNPTWNIVGGAINIALFVGFIILFRRADSVRHALARIFLWTGLAVLASPIGTLLYGAGVTSRQTTAANGLGAGAGTGIATIAVAFIAFFVAAILLVIAYALSRGGRPGRTKRCPRCAEEIQEAAMVCRFCGAELVATATPVT